MRKDIEYASKILSKISELFEEDSELQIDKTELMEEENLTLFFHALANVVPCNLFGQLTGENKNVLEFNHIANHLIFQYAKTEK
jgi:hypothetical protein